MGKDLIEAGNFGSSQIQDRIDEIERQWTNLMDLSDYRKKRLAETVDFHQVICSNFKLLNMFYVSYLSWVNSDAMEVD